MYGARPLRRLIQREVETRIARALVAGELAEGVTVTVDVVGDTLEVRWRTDTGQPSAEAPGSEREPVAV